MQDLAETYRQTSDSDLIRIHADIGNLTLEAQQRLLAEIHRRGLTDSQVSETKEQWKQEVAEDAQVEREKRIRHPIRWSKIIAQICVIIAIGALYAVLANVIRNLTPEAEQTLGSLVAMATMLCLAIALGFLRERLVATIWMSLVVYALITGWVFVLH
jgi:ABC-type Fe3+-siderophore transport system permease subunit